MNLLNNTQFSGSYQGGLGGTITTPSAAQAALGLQSGHGQRQQLRDPRHGDVQSAADLA